MKATKSVGDFYDLDMNRAGMEDVLKKEMEDFGIRHCFLLSTATSPSQVRGINDFLIDVLKRNGTERFTAFGTVHPHSEAPVEEIDYMRKNGITGIKFHHDFQGVAADDPCLDVIYDKAQAEGIPVYVHAGDSRYSYTNPRQLLNVYRKFPRLILIAAHFGGYSVWEDACRELKNTGFYFDTSSSLFALSPQRATEMLRCLGVERFFFATDFPMWDFEGEWQRFSQLRLTDSEFDAVVYRNAERFMSQVLKKQ